MKSVCLIVLLCLAAIQAAPTSIETKVSKCISLSGIGNSKLKTLNLKFKKQSFSFNINSSEIF